MNPVLAKVLKKTLTTSATVVGALFVVYFWNLDQKLMGWLYKQVNTMFDRKPVDTYQQLVNPMRNLNPFITQLTGITPDMLEPAPTLDTVLPDFLRWCGDDAMIGHNIMQFDIKFIDLAAQHILHHAVPNRIIDTLQMSRSMYPQYNRHRLVDLIQRFDIADVEEHRALSDAEQTQMCFEYMRDEQRRRDC